MLNLLKKDLRFYIQNAGELSKEVGYVPLAEKDYKLTLEKFEKWSNTMIGENQSRLNVKKASLK